MVRVNFLERLIISLAILLYAYGHIHKYVSSVHSRHSAGEQSPSSVTDSDPSRRISGSPTYPDQKSRTANIDNQVETDAVAMLIPSRLRIPETIPIVGSVALSHHDIHAVSSRVSGYIHRIFVSDDQLVNAGDVLAEIDSSEYVSAENELLLTYRVHKTLISENAVDDFTAEIESRYRSAISSLIRCGISSKEIRSLIAAEHVRKYLLLKAPVPGLFEKQSNASNGVVKAGDVLAYLINIHAVSIVASINEDESESVKPGQDVSFETLGNPQQKITGRITSVESTTTKLAKQMLEIRCEVDNRKAFLKPGMLVEGFVKADDIDAWVVNKSAVIHIDNSDYVIVQDNDKTFRQIAVRGHAIDPEQYAVVSGLPDGHSVVSDGNALLSKLLNKHVKQG